MKKKCYCEKCEEETMHHYFMMFPAGYFVCNVCGTTEGDDGKPVWHIYYHKLPSYKLLRLCFKFSGVTWRKEDGPVHRWDEMKTFKEFKEWCLENDIGWGCGLDEYDTNWGEAKNYKELREMFKKDGVNFAFKLKNDKGLLGDDYKALQKYVSGYDSDLGTIKFKGALDRSLKESNR